MTLSLFREETASKSPYIYDFGAVLLLIAFVLVRYNSILQNFWLGDDPKILQHAISYRPWEYFFRPDAWRDLSVVNFTPWITFTYNLDLIIFGLDPFGFYLHQLVSLSVLAIVSYVVLRVWFPLTFSLFGVLLFVASPPFAESAHFLMFRHYFEGMIFALLSVYFYSRNLEKNKQALTVVSSSFYLLSCLANPIYVPLLFFLALLPRGGWRDRLRNILPFVCVAFLYAIWRWIMLGMLFGGYGVELTWPSDAKLFLSRVINAMGMGSGEKQLSWWKWVVVVDFLAVLLLLYRIEKKSRMVTFIEITTVSAAILLPIVPVSPIMEPRYVMLPLFLWLVLHLVTWKKIRTYIARPSVQTAFLFWFSVVIAFFLVASSSNNEKLKLYEKRQKEEGIFFLKEGGENDLLISSITIKWYFEGLSWIRNQVLHLPKGPAIISDTNLICFDEKLSPQHYKNIWYLDLRKDALVSEKMLDFKTRQCQEDSYRKIRMDVPLRLIIEYDYPKVSWKFGPYKEGNYSILLGATAYSDFPLSDKGHMNEPLQTNLFRLRYISPEGWSTYSPLLQLNISGGRGTVDWRR